MSMLIGKASNRKSLNNSTMNDEKTNSKAAMTNDMIKIIESPGQVHVKLVSSILNSISISFFEDQGYINAKDLQI